MANELTVAEAHQNDVGKSVARIPSGTMDDLGIVPGDIVSIEGNDEAVATARRAGQQDQGLNIIRIDGTDLANLCREAGMETIRRVTRENGSIDDITTTQKDFETAYNTVKTDEEDTDANS